MTTLHLNILWVGGLDLWMIFMSAEYYMFESKRGLKNHWKAKDRIYTESHRWYFETELDYTDGIV